LDNYLDLLDVSVFHVHHNQWRGSVVKSEGSGSLRSSHQTKSRPKLAFVFGAKNGLFGHFRLFLFSTENEFSFLFYFSFSFQKCHLRWAENVMFATEPYLKFCDIGTCDFRFRFSAEKGLSLSSAFSFTAENEKCIFGRPVHQTILDYTYVNDFQTFNNPGSGQP